MADTIAPSSGGECRRTCCRWPCLSIATSVGECRGVHGPTADPRSLIVEATLGQIQHLVRRGTLTCESIIRAHLQRIAAYDKRSGLNAITLVNGNAISEARAIDLKIGRGQHLGRLFCAPVLVKDNIDTAGIATTGGSIALRSFIPDSDATIVARIRAADAIVVAKTNMAEWAISARQTVSSSFGTTANAYALDRVPAGSSGGTASGIAASFGVLGIGTDTGNSVRGPASHLALFGLRPTLGLVSRAGIIPFALDTDTAGPMTRTVSDGARLLTAIAGRDQGDPYTYAIPKGEAQVYESFLNRHGLSGRRIGVLRALSNPSDTNPDILKLFESAIPCDAQARCPDRRSVDPSHARKTSVVGRVFVPTIQLRPHEVHEAARQPCRGSGSNHCSRARCTARIRS